MSEEIKTMEDYESDKRIPCQYSKNCYQKNSAHHSKYKHPPKNTHAHDNEENQAKKRKLDPESKDFIHDNSPDRTEDSREKSPKPNTSSEIASEITQNSQTLLSDSKLFIKDKFLLEFPQDFYDFWEFCKDLKPNNPAEALKDAGLLLVGAFDVLAGHFSNIDKSREEYLRHWRYYYDPPELQTVLKGDERTGFHIGYFFDSPNEPPAFLVCNLGTKNGILTKMGDNIFATVHMHLEQMKTRGDPFKKMSYIKLQKSIKTKAEELKLNMNSHSEKIKQREKKIVTKTWNKIGLVVPYDKKTELGYRDLAVGDSELKTLLNKLQEAVPEQRPKYLSELQPVFTFASIALDECDFGTGVKLGWNILAHGIDSLNSTILRFLTNSYKLLKRDEFAQIAEAHLTERKKGTNLSILN